MIDSVFTPAYLSRKAKNRHTSWNRGLRTELSIDCNGLQKRFNYLKVKAMHPVADERGIMINYHLSELHQVFFRLLELGKSEYQITEDGEDG